MQRIPKFRSADKQSAVAQGPIQEVVLQHGQISSSLCEERLQKLLQVSVAHVVLRWVALRLLFHLLWRLYLRDSSLSEDSLLVSPFDLFLFLPSALFVPLCLLKQLLLPQFLTELFKLFLFTLPHDCRKCTQFRTM